jgi:hypothetical protein
MLTTPTRAAIYAIYLIDVPTMLWADAGLRARFSFEYIMVRPSLLRSAIRRVGYSHRHDYPTDML